MNKALLEKMISSLSLEELNELSLMLNDAPHTATIKGAEWSIGLRLELLGVARQRIDELEGESDGPNPNQQ